jgi:hypothetical protein
MVEGGKLEVGNRPKKRYGRCLPGRFGDFARNLQSRLS